jgi:hypothetical protein
VAFLFYLNLVFNRFLCLISSYVTGYICYSFILIVIILFSYLLIYLGIRFFWYIFPCHAFYSLSFLFKSSFFNRFLCLMLSYVTGCICFSFTLIVIIQIYFLLIYLGIRLFWYIFSCKAFYRPSFLLKSNFLIDFYA